MSAHKDTSANQKPEEKWKWHITQNDSSTRRESVCGAVRRLSSSVQWGCRCTFTTEVNMTPRPPLTTSSLDPFRFLFQVDFTELIHRDALRLRRVLPGDRPDLCTQRCLCVHPPHPRPPRTVPALHPPPPTSQPVPWPVEAGRLNVMTPFFPGCPLRTLHPINFHSAFREIPGLYPHQL